MRTRLPGGCKKSRFDTILGEGRIKIACLPENGHGEDGKSSTGVIVAQAHERRKLIFPEDKVYVDGAPLPEDSPHELIFALYKPSGISCDLGVSAPPSFAQSLPPHRRHADLASWFKSLSPALRHIGRLDKATTGLLLAGENAGGLTSLIIEPGLLQKTYEARVRCKSPDMPTRQQLTSLMDGKLRLKDGPARCIEVTVLSKETKIFEKGSSRKLSLGASAKRRRTGNGPAKVYKQYESVLRITIDIGRHRIVRRILAAVDLPCMFLKRTAIGSLSLDNLFGPDGKPGDSVQLDRAQIDTLWKDVGGRALLRKKHLLALTKIENPPPRLIPYVHVATQGLLRNVSTRSRS